jgi:hypothetical protein
MKKPNIKIKYLEIKVEEHELDTIFDFVFNNMELNPIDSSSKDTYIN